MRHKLALHTLDHGLQKQLIPIGIITRLFAVKKRFSHKVEPRSSEEKLEPNPWKGMSTFCHAGIIWIQSLMAMRASLLLLLERRASWLPQGLYFYSYAHRTFAPSSPIRLPHAG